MDKCPSCGGELEEMFTNVEDGKTVVVEWECEDCYIRIAASYSYTVHTIVWDDMG